MKQNWRVVVSEFCNVRNETIVRCGANPMIFDDAKANIRYMAFIPKSKTISISVIKMPTTVEVQSGNIVSLI
jgi:hypothetical protein